MELNNIPKYFSYFELMRKENGGIGLWMRLMADRIQPADFEQLLDVTGGDTGSDDSVDACICNAATSNDVPVKQAEAMMCVALCYMRGIGVEADMDKACYWMTKSGNAGCGAAAAWCGDHLLERDDVFLVMDSAKLWFAAADRYGYAIGKQRLEECRLLSLFFERIKQEDLNKDQICEKELDRNGCDTKECDKPGEKDYQYALNAYHWGNNVAAVLPLLRAATVMHIDAAREVAYNYYKGHGTFVNKMLAFYIYKELAEKKNDKKSMYLMAECLRLDFGSPNDIEVAEYWYKKAFELGVKKAAYGLAVIYETKDDKKHLVPDFRYKAAQTGVIEAIERSLPMGKTKLADAQTELAKVQASGNDKAVQKADKKVSRLWDQLIRWLRKLANNGNVDSMYELAQLYDGGRPSMADPQKAYYWYIQAARKGHKFAGQ